MTRLTRAQSQERTRELIVQAAMRLFLRDGFRVTSLERIGEEAGFTRGAVYSNFPSKTAVGIAVIDELYRREERELARALAATGDLDGWFDALAGWADRSVGDPRWTLLEIEISASSAHHEAYRAATAARYARLRAGCATLLRGRFGDALPLDADTLAGVILAVILGTGAQRSADPGFSGSGWVRLLRAAAESTKPETTKAGTR